MPPRVTNAVADIASAPDTAPPATPTSRAAAVPQVARQAVQLGRVDTEAVPRLTGP